MNRSFDTFIALKNRRTFLLLGVVLSMTAFGIVGLRAFAQNRVDQDEVGRVSTGPETVAARNNPDRFMETFVPLYFDTDDALFKMPSIRGKRCNIQDIGNASQPNRVVKPNIRSAKANRALVRAGNKSALVNTIIYDTTHTSLQGVEISNAANGPATQMGDLITLGGTNRFISSVTIDVFTLASVAPFNLTMKFYTDCSTSGAANSPCGNGTGTLIPGSTVTVSNITPPALGTGFTVTFLYPGGLNLTTEVDNTVSVSVNASRTDVFWDIDEAPVTGSSTAVVERCGSVGVNNGCTRNFGIQNNFAMTIIANNVPTAANVEVSGRVLTSEGRGLRNSLVTLTDQNGNSRSTMTGPLGSYRFNEVEAGQTYVVRVLSRRFTFSPRVIQIVDSIADLDFIAGQ